MAIASLFIKSSIAPTYVLCKKYIILVRMPKYFVHPKFIHRLIIAFNMSANPQ